MTRYAREALSLAVASALGEAALLALVTDWAQVGPNVLVFGFLIGPLLFLALTVWRRRTHPARSKVLFGVALGIAVAGLGALGVDSYRFQTDPAFRQTPSVTRMLVPVVQWAVILVVWVWLVAQEMKDRRAAKNRTQSP
ncbi:MAG TPA: hypothetical protein VGE74_18660 [Gemmata sp.]